MPIDAREIRNHQHRLQLIAERAVPYAIRDALNATAFDARRESIKNIKEDFIIRKTWTERTIQVERAALGPVESMQSVIGSIAPYMATQEGGGIVRPDKGRTITIPTSYSAGMADNANPRTRDVRPANQIRSIALGSKPMFRAANQAQKNLITVRVAAKQGKRFVYLETAKRHGFYRVLGGRKFPAKATVKLVQDATNPTVRVKGVFWLRDASDAARASLLDHYHAALSKQLDRVR